MKLLTVKDNAELLLRFWEAEKVAPRWFRESTEPAEFENDFLEWCGNFWRIYGLLNNSAVLFADKEGRRAVIHFAVLPKTDTSELLTELELIKTDMFCAGIEVIFGWVARQNRGLRRICEQMGMTYYGFRKFYRQSHGRVIEWRGYGIAQTRILVARNPRSMLFLTKDESL